MTHTFLPRRLPPLLSSPAARAPCLPELHVPGAGPCPACVAWEEGWVLLVDGKQVPRRQWLAYYEAAASGGEL